MRSIRDNITEEVLLNEIQEIIRLPMYADRIRNDSKAHLHTSSARRRWWDKKCWVLDYRHTFQDYLSRRAQRLKWDYGVPFLMHACICYCRFWLVEKSWGIYIVYLGVNEIFRYFVIRQSFFLFFFLIVMCAKLVTCMIQWGTLE